MRNLFSRFPLAFVLLTEVLRRGAVMALRALRALTIPGQPLGLTPLCPWSRTPCQVPRAINLCPSDTAAGTVSSSPQPCPAQLWTLPSYGPCQARPTHRLAVCPASAHVHPQAGAGAVPASSVCPAPGWGDGVGSGCQALP